MIDGVMVSLIAAVAENGVIGRDGDMPWHIPSDFKHFKATTMGKPIIMGRKQFETVGKPLPGRTNIVVTRQAGYQPDGVLVMSDLDAALDHAAAIARADGADEIMVIGGGEIYAQTIERADRLYISHVQLAVEGDVAFPVIDLKRWTVERRMDVVPMERDDAEYAIVVYERRNQ